MCQPVPDRGLRSQEATSGFGETGPGMQEVQEHLSNPASGQLVSRNLGQRAVEVPEAANLVCSSFERAFVGRSTKHTGQNVVIVTPGTGVYHVDYDLAQLTKHRFVDNGCGCDTFVKSVNSAFCSLIAI